MPAGEPLPLPDEPSFAALPFQSARHDPDQEHVAGGLNGAASAPPALSNRESGAAGEHALSPGDREAHAAQAEKGMAPTGRRAARNPLFAVVLIGVASLLVTAAWLLSSPSPLTTASTKDPIALAGVAEPAGDRLNAQVPSIIVLPFINLSGDAKRDYLADGITDSLISDLVRALPGISIVSRDTAFTYKGRGTDPRQIGRELGVRYLLAGSVVFEGERVRVNIQLAETKEGSQLWA